MYKTISKCRACQSTDLVGVFSFEKPMPLANNFTLPGEERAGFVPLRVMFCRNCTLGQLGEVVNPEILYKHYLYVTSSSFTMKRHFDRMLKDLISENGVGRILEVGSNDGAFLNFAAQELEVPVVGIDPAENLSVNQLAPRVTGLFNEETARAASELLNNEIDYIVARHCFCHQEWYPFMQACSVVAHDKTLIAIEVPYAPDLLKRAEFDTIYHEHTSFLTIKSVVALLKNSPFHLHGVLKYGIHGGAVLLMLRHNNSGIQPHLSADEFLAEEHVTEQEWLEFAVKSGKKISLLSDQVMQLIRQGKTISMFGASAKGSVLIGACGFTQEHISFVTDNSPFKPGRLVPGTSIPVIDESEMLSHHPDYAICAAWNFRTEILQKMDKYHKRGGKFIFPVSDGWEIV